MHEIGCDDTGDTYTDGTATGTVDDTGDTGNDDPGPCYQIPCLYHTVSHGNGAQRHADRSKP